MPENKKFRELPNSRVRAFLELPQVEGNAICVFEVVDSVQFLRTYLHEMDYPGHGAGPKGLPPLVSEKVRVAEKICTTKSPTTWLTAQQLTAAIGRWEVSFQPPRSDIDFARLLESCLNNFLLRTPRVAHDSGNTARIVLWGEAVLRS